jgi:LL-diaminopimelate aminotransferase
MKSSRLLSLPKYLFEELASRHAQAVSSGRDVINLSIGDPDLDPPESLKRRLVAALEKSSNHCYPPQRGTDVLKRAVGDFLNRHHGVKPRDNEILILVGSKEGIGHLPLAVCNQGDGVLVPDPGYPVYRASAILAGCEPIAVGLERNNGFLPDFGALPADQLRRARLCFINYPNNPTSVAASPSSLREVLEMMEDRNIILANDAAYADIFFDERPAVLSSLSGALDAGSIEFFSFSKMLSITGWRVGFAVGNRIRARAVQGKAR